jgi:hypothetical protein
MISRDLFGEIFCGKKWELSTDLVAKHEWCSIVILGYPDLLQFELISNALKQRNINKLLCLSRGGASSEDQASDVLNSDQISMSETVFSKNYLCLALTTENLDFVLFKDDANEYYILAGPTSFMSVAHKRSFTAAKSEFFDEIEGMRTKAKSSFKDIWERYVVPY